jgi:hypothetical protein
MCATCPTNPILVGLTNQIFGKAWLHIMKLLAVKFSPVSSKSRLVFLNSCLQTQPMWETKWDFRFSRRWVWIWLSAEMLYSVVDTDRRFRGAYCLHHQGIALHVPASQKVQIAIFVRDPSPHPHETSKFKVLDMWWTDQTSELNVAIIHSVDLYTRFYAEKLLLYSSWKIHKCLQTQ